MNLEIFQYYLDEIEDLENEPSNEIESNLNDDKLIKKMMRIICSFKIWLKNLKREGQREQKELKVLWNLQNLKKVNSIVKFVSKPGITQIHVHKTKTICWEHNIIT